MSPHLCGFALPTAVPPCRVKGRPQCNSSHHSAGRLPHRRADRSRLYHASGSRLHLHMSQGKPSVSAPNAALSPWLKTNKGSLSEDLDLTRADPRTKLGVSISNSAASPVSKNTELVVLPETVYLSSRTARDKLEQQCGALKDVEGLSHESWLALQLLHERSKGPDSDFEPLLADLPRLDELDVTALWAPEELMWLSGSPVYERSMEVAEGVEAEWVRLKDGAVMELFRASDSDFSLDLYRWAIAVVDARGASNADADELVLAPVVHMLSPAAQNATARVKFGTTGMFFNAKPCVKVVLLRDVAAGDEVTIAYGAGAMRNSDLLLERGVTVASNKANAAEVSFSLTTMDPFYEDKVDILELYGSEAGLSASPTFQLEERVGRVVDDDDDPDNSLGWTPPEDLDTYLRLLCLGGVDAFLLEGIFRSEIWEHLSLPISAANEASVCRTMVDACEDALEAYGGGAEERGAGRRWEMARTVVEGEQRILRQAIATYGRRLRGLDGTEFYAERRLKALDLLRPVDESEVVDSESGARVGRAFDENY